LKNEIKEAVLNDPYSTTRLSSANWRKWIYELTFQKIEIIQSNCRDMMVLMGYNKVENKTLLNSTSLLTEFCSHQTFTFC